MDISNGLQTFGQYFGGLQAGKKDQAVYLAHPPVFFINRAYFPADDKAGADPLPHRGGEKILFF